MVNLLIGAVLGMVGTWLVMTYRSPSLIHDKITGEVTAIVHEGKTFIEATAHRVGL